MAAEATGYLHPEYAASLAEFGRPRQLPRSGGWLLERAVPGSHLHDAMGPYPLFACRDWSGLADDVRDLNGELVSVPLVADPLGEWTESQLRAAFPDALASHKDHYVVDLGRPISSIVSRHHARNARRALKGVTVQPSADPALLLDDWHRLYDELVRRHGIRGIPAFSRRAFERQLAVPGITAFVAGPLGHPLGMLLWYVQGTVAYYHLGAFSAEGYAQGAPFALFWRALEHFTDAGLKRVSLGGGAGASAASHGLARFKRGWSTGTRPAPFCGRILDRSAYRALIGSSASTGYFPAYRRGEFA